MDSETGVFADHTKVHRVDFDGKWYKSRGPLNVVATPQGRPVFVQAGGSPRGRQFAARHAETVIASVHSVAQMKDYRDDVRSRMVTSGRDPDTCKVMFACAPVLADTSEEAAAKKARMTEAAAAHAELALAALSNLTHIDFSTFDMDAPLPELETNGSQSTLAEFTKGNEGLTLREIALKRAGNMGMALVGTAEEVAEQMGETMDQVGGDGFLIAGSLRPKYIAELVDNLVPALQRRGLVRTEYPYDTFRANLMEF
jgi:alkanesulfonate monooxygenase SsuD/methylene tetrahydromethanopterin reductase-like flavin-dependent oxidoreductase (luciferase family)